MDDTSSESSAATLSPTVTSVLGVKGALRFRRHGASQKAHVVLRRVDLSDDSNYAGSKPSVAYFSLFAQKRIEVKPGKEILLAVASEDSSFTDQAVIFEGDLSPPDSTSEEEEEVEKQIMQDDTFPDSPLTHIVPPKMRRTWTKQLEQVSPVLDTVMPPSRTYASIAVQAEPTWSVSSVQTAPAASPVQEKAVLLPSESHNEQPAVAEEPRVEPEALTPEPPRTPFENEPIPDGERSRSLSPMSIGSPPSTPAQSPLLGRSINLIQIPSTPVEEPPVGPVGDILSIPQEDQEAKPFVAVAHVDDAIIASQVSPVSSETVDMDLQSSPSSSEVDDDEIPGLVTGSVSRRPGLPAPPRQPSPLVLPPPQTRPHPILTAPPSLSTPPPTSGMSSAIEPNETKSVTPPLSAGALPRRPVFKNPFVSGGFMTEFVGKRESLTTQKAPAPKEVVDPESSGARSKTVFTAESLKAKHDSDAPPLPISKPSLNYISTHAPSGSVLEAQPSLIPRQSPAVPQPQPPMRQMPSLPPPSLRPTESTPQYPQKASAWSNYPPHINDPNLEYNPIESLSKSLNMYHPPHYTQPPPQPPPPPPPIYQNPSVQPPSPYQASPSRTPAIGNGWPHIHSNGHASVPSALSLSQKKAPPQLARPSSPGSARSSTTPPGLSNPVQYLSPSPPGFLHSVSSHKASPVREQAAYHQTAVQSLQQQLYQPATPQIKHESTDWTSPGISSSSASASAAQQSIRIQAPRPMAPPSSASAVLQYRHPTASSSSTPSEDSRGKKRALDGDVGVESSRPRKRNYPWPSQDHIYSAQIKSDEDAGVQQITFSSDGDRFAVICADRSIRIWNTPHRVETARLAQNAPVLAVAWMIDDVGVVSLGQDGLISKWTRNNQNHWQWAKLLDAGKEDSVCFAYQRDRIAVAFPRLGVKVWIWIKGTWQPQRSILRQNVTSIKFVQDGEALIGGTSDGVLWYCQVPNGTLRAYAFLKSKVLHLDVNAAGTHALVSQSGGRAHLVGIQQMDHKGKIEQVYATNGDEPKQVVGAVFANSCRSVLFGMMDSNLLVWDKAKGEIIYGLDHDGEQAQAIACFDKGSSAHIVTGTKSGLLCWWKPPPAD